MRTHDSQGRPLSLKLAAQGTGLINGEMPTGFNNIALVPQQLMEKLMKEDFFLVPVSPCVRFERGENCAFFGRAIFDHFWSSTAPALRFLAVSLFLALDRPSISATLS